LIIARKDFLSAIELHFHLNETKRKPKTTELDCRGYKLLVSSIMRRSNRVGLVITWEPKKK
jgi:hypothetical protein